MTNYKNESYNSILVIVDHLTKMVYYKLVKITINVANLTEIILHVVVQPHNFFHSIVLDRGLLFTLKF